MDEATLKQIIDTVFAYVETSQASHPLVVAILKGLNVVVDDAALPIILGQLKAKGLV